MLDVQLARGLVAAVRAGRDAGAGRRRRSAAVGGPGAGAARHHRIWPRAGGAADRGVPPGRGLGHRRERLSHPRRRACRSASKEAERRLFRRRRRRARARARHGGASCASERIPSAFGLDPMRDVQVLTPMHRGAAGTEGLNRALQEALNPGGAAVEVGGARGALVARRRQGDAGAQRLRARRVQRRRRRHRRARDATRTTSRSSRSTSTGGACATRPTRSASSSSPTR